MAFEPRAAMIRFGLIAIALAGALCARADPALPLGEWKQADVTYYGGWEDGACAAVTATRRTVTINSPQYGAAVGAYVSQRSARYLRKAATCAFPGNPLGERVWEQAHIWGVKVAPQTGGWRLEAQGHACRFQACDQVQGMPDSFTTSLKPANAGRLFDSGDSASAAGSGLLYRDAAAIADAEASAVKAADAIIAQIKAGRIDAVLAAAPPESGQTNRCRARAITRLPNIPGRCRRSPADGNLDPRRLHRRRDQRPQGPRGRHHLA
jgi:hypothetical protein